MTSLSNPLPITTPLGAADRVPVLAPAAPANEPTPASLPLVSVIVPVRNEAACIERTLAHLVAQHYDPERFEILVIDGRSTDGTQGLVADFARRHPNVRLLDNPRRLSSAARNLGVQQARGEILVVVDGHCELDNRDLLGDLVDAFRRSGADCVGRPQPLDVTDASPWQRAIAAARSSPLGHHPDSHIYSSQEGFVPAGSVAVAYKRSVFDAVGLFDEWFDACEDVELNHRVDRAGLRCFFTPRVAIRYRPRASLRGLFRQMVRYGRGRMRLLRKHRDTFSWGTMVPLVFVAGLIVGLPLSLAAPWLRLLYTVSLASYTAIVLLVSLGIGLRRGNMALLPRLPFVFATIHLGSGAGMLLELCWPGGVRRTGFQPVPTHGRVENPSYEANDPDGPRHVVVVDEELPYPANSGKRIRTLNLISRLAQRHRITYLAYRGADAEETERAAAHLRSLGIETVLVDRRLPAKSGTAFYGRLLWNLLSPLPYSVQIHKSAALRRAIRDYAATHAVDLWHCEWTPYAASLRGVVSGPWVVMAHNVESLIWQRYYETESSPLKRWYIGRQWQKFERFERRAFASAARTIAVSDEDAALARERFGAERVDVVENGVDVDYFRPDGSARNPRSILFLGSLDWRPNLDAVQRLLDQVFPQVLREEPLARLVIVGRKPPRWLVERVGGCERVELQADVADVRPFLRQCGVMAVPLRIGGGSRLKILEALAAECPVVSTRVGAEGLCLVPGTHFVRVEAVEEMASTLVQCLRDPKPLADMAALGRQVVCQRYDWSILARKLETLWQHPQRS